MSDARLFGDFRAALSVTNAADISVKYANITARLNKDFWDTDSDTAHSLQIGSYGRHTAVNGVSDLDMVFELPASYLERYKGLARNGPSVMLQEVRSSLLNRYPNTDVKADGQIVGVHFKGYRVEVLPAFRDANGDYIHGDTNDGGSWKLTKPRPEIRAVAELDTTTHGALKDVCKMLRAWKDQVGIGVGGLLIDTLAYNFFVEHPQFDNVGYGDYPELFVTLFSYLGGLPEQKYWMAPGSGQRVRCKAHFQEKAKRAASRCREAVTEEDEGKKTTLWRKVFSTRFPKVETLLEARAASFDKEEFIEDKHPVDIRYNIGLECKFEMGGLLSMLRTVTRRRERVPAGKRLRFFVSECDVPGDFTVLWKVRNRGLQAISRRDVRGEILEDVGGQKERIETAVFGGDHYVEVYAIQDGVCVAREKITVPI